MAACVLVVEDERKIRDLLRSYRGVCQIFDTLISSTTAST